MKINDTRNKRAMLFEDLADGDVFMWEDRVFMRISEVADADSGEVFNAWSFQSNYFDCFDNSNYVTKINAELTIF